MKRAVRSLDDSLFRLLQEHVPDPVYILRVQPGQASTIIFANRIFFERTGLSREKVIGAELEKALRSINSRVNEKAITRCFKTDDLYIIEDEVALPEGQAFWSTQLVPFAKEAKTEANYVACITADHLLHCQVNPAMLLLHQQMRAVLNSTSEGMTLLDKSSRIVAFNETASEVLKLTGGQAMELGKSIYDCVVADREEVVRERLAKAFAGERSEYEVELVKPEGKRAWFDIYYYPVYDDRKKMMGVVINLRDITRRKEHELLLQTKNRRLREIAAIQSHEIRKPVANILGLIALLNVGEGFSPEVQEIVQHLKDSATELDSVIGKIVRKTG